MFPHFHTVRELQSKGLSSIPFHTMFADDKRNVDCRYAERLAKRKEKAAAAATKSKRSSKSTNGKAKATKSSAGKKHKGWQQ